MEHEYSMDELINIIKNIGKAINAIEKHSICLSNEMVKMCHVMEIINSRMEMLIDEDLH